MFPPLYFHLFVPFFLIHSINYMNKLQQRKIMRRCSVMIWSQKGVSAPAFTWVAQHRLQPGLRHTAQVQGADKQATIGCQGRGLTAVTTGIHLCPHKHDERAFFKYPSETNPLEHINHGATTTQYLGWAHSRVLLFISLCNHSLTLKAV